MNAYCRGPDAEERLRELCRFVKAHEHIADSHNVDFFTSDSWSSLPAPWQRQLLALPDSTLCQLPLASDAVLSSTSGQSAKQNTAQCRAFSRLMPHIAKLTAIARHLRSTCILTAYTSCLVLGCINRVTAWYMCALMVRYKGTVFQMVPNSGNL